MDLFQFADKMGRELVVRRKPYTKEFWCSIPESSVMMASSKRFLGEMRGTGKSVKSAMQAYVRNIRDRIVTFHEDDRSSRVGWRAPKNLRVPKL